jgi:hypothetical protein
MIIRMKSLKYGQKMARFLLSSFCSLVMLLSVSGFSLQASDLSSPIILPSVELITPVQLVDGIVSEVTSPSYINHKVAIKHLSPSTRINDLAFGAKKVTSHSSSLAKTASFSFFKSWQSVGYQNSCSLEVGANTPISDSHLSSWGLLSLVLREKYTMQAEARDLKSIANLATLAFFEICLCQSELPSKNLSTQCESCLWKSTTRRSANVWRFSWPQARTTFRLPRSTFSSQTQRISILDPLPSHLPSMFDISSTWPKETARFRLIWVAMAHHSRPIPMLPQNVRVA